MSAGISDWGMLVATGEAGTAEAELGGSCGWEGPGPHAHDQVSPISFVSKVRTPVLIVHGEDDTNVPLGQAIYFHRATYGGARWLWSTGELYYCLVVSGQSRTRAVRRASRDRIAA
jgi:Prolyl oligopeptidase family